MQILLQCICRQRDFHALMLAFIYNVSNNVSAKTNVDIGMVPLIK